MFLEQFVKLLMVKHTLLLTYFTLGSKLFGTAATDLRKSTRLTRIMRTICNAGPGCQEALLACRLIPLDKNPGMRSMDIA